MSREFLKFLVILLVFLPTIALAEGLSDGMTDTTDDRYVVKKGDTLWDISSDKLRDPFLWPRLWKANPRIRNPHLIFPGAEIAIPSKAGAPEREEIQEEVAVEKKPTRIIVPQSITQTRIPVQKRNFLVSREMLLQSGYIAEGIPVLGSIYLSPKMRTLLGKHDELYIEAEKPLEPHTQLYIASEPEKVLHPVTGYRMGFLIRIVGLLETLGDENGNQKARIKESFEEIKPGAFLIPFYPAVAPVEPEQLRKPLISGIVLLVRKDRDLSAMRDIVYLDKGKNDGLEIGDLFTIISGAIPGYPIGDVTIISVRATTSVAFVKRSITEIKAGDIFKN